MDDEMQRLLILLFGLILGLVVMFGNQNVCNEKCNNLPAHNVSTGEILK